MEDLLGVIHAASGDFRQASLGSARAAVIYDYGRYAIGDTALRHEWVEEGARIYAWALWLAETIEDQSLLAELIERARAQGLPAGRSESPRAFDVRGPHFVPAPRLRNLGLGTSKRRRRGGRPRSDLPPAPSGGGRQATEGGLAATLAAAGDLPTTAPITLHLTSGRPSLLRSLAPELPPLRDKHKQPIEANLEELTAAIAGTGAWWWGSWDTAEHIHWFTLAPPGQLTTGEVALADLEEPLAELEAALPLSRNGESQKDAAWRALRGSMAHPEREQRLASQLGRLLLPPALLRALRERTADRPLPVVVAPAPRLGRVPFALLALDEKTRLMEKSVVTVAGSAALLAGVAARGPTPQRSGTLAIIDPGGNRLYAVPPEGSDLLPALPSLGSHVQVLTRSAHLPQFCKSHKATGISGSSSLSEILRTSHPELVVYVGHVGQLDPGRPAAAHLLLADNDVLTAKEWMDKPHRWPAPRRVVLLGCDSGAHHHPEALGLATGALWAGAEQVVTSAWDLLDLPIVARLAEGFASSPPQEDLAAALRRLVGVGGCLGRWRQTGDREDSPLTWGSLAVTGRTLSVAAEDVPSSV